MTKNFYVCCYKECFRRGLDAGRMTRYLVANGWKPVTRMGRADLVVIYTCGGFDFTERRCLKTIERALSRKKAPPRVIVTGCLLKINPGPLERIDGIELVPPETPDRFDAALQAEAPFRQIPDANFVPENVRDLDDASLFRKFFQRLEFNRHSWKILFYMFDRKIRGEKESSHAFVKDVFKIKIADGCLGRCTYCALRLAGGRLRSKPLDQVLDEFREGLKAGFRRFEFVSLDLGCYGRDLGIELSQLLETVFRLAGDFKLILNDLNVHWLIRDTPLLPLLVRFKSRLEHLRVPIQSGSDRVLKRMKRPYRESEIHDVLDRLFREMPEVPICSHFLVGFPGETGEDFQATARLVDKYRFSKIDVFCYQDRPGVESAGFEDKVPRPLIQKRANELAAKRRGIDISYT
jgi:threonylcarbamoyladenosine tRNA methylthiotransferase CDKAL1